MQIERDIVFPATPAEVWEAITEAEPEERLVLDWDDEGEVVLELEEVDGGTRLHVTETSPDWSAALELHALAWVAVA